MAYRHVSLERKGAVALCTLSNPPMNFMNAVMVRELDQVTREVEASRDDRVLVLTGGVDGIFITHYDVGELVTAAEAPAAAPTGEALMLIHRLFNRIERMPKVTVAALNGTAMGGGCELSLACDFRLMADGPFRYGLPETSLGIIPGAGGTQRMARLLGTARALDLILHAELMEPRAAHALGLVHRLLPTDRFLEHALAFAGDLAERAPIALAAAKEAIRRGMEVPLDDGLGIEQRAFLRTMQTADAREAMRAYVRGESYRFRGE
jgi:enoyl-CoA hydratase/carnithine racemase